MTDRFPEPLFQALNSSGVPISGAKLNFYITGTSTRKDTYSDSAKTTPNANPVVADSAGRFGDIFMDLDVQYRVVYTDASDVTITTLDNVSPVRSNPVPKITTSAKSSNYTVQITDEGFLVLVDASSGAVTVTLPAAATATNGFSIRVKKTDSSENVVTVDGDGAETIDGFTTFALGSQYASGLFVTNGTAWHVASEGRSSQSLAVSKSANYTVVAGDRNKTFICTSTFTLALTAAATLGDGFVIWARNDGTGTITVDPNGAETIDGASDLALTSGTSVRIVCDGSNFKTTGGGSAIPLATAPPEISNGTDATNDIDIAVGKCRDDADTANLEITTAIGKQIDVSWATGGTTGAPTGGLSSSLTLTNDTWYHVILGLVSGAVEVGFDTSITGANLVTDHSFSNTRRIGSVRRGTATNLAFTQVGNIFLLDAAILDVDTTNPGTSAVTSTLTAPLGVQTVPLARYFYQNINAGNYVVFSALDQTDAAPSTTAAPLGDAGATTAFGRVGHLPEIWTNTSSQIRYRQTDVNASTVVRIATYGWKDTRGRDA